MLLKIFAEMMNFSEFIYAIPGSRYIKSNKYVFHVTYVRAYGSRHLYNIYFIGLLIDFSFLQNYRDRLSMQISLLYISFSWHVISTKLLFTNWWVDSIWNLFSSCSNVSHFNFGWELVFLLSWEYNSMSGYWLLVASSIMFSTSLYK